MFLLTLLACSTVQHFGATPTPAPSPTARTVGEQLLRVLLAGDAEAAAALVADDALLTVSPDEVTVLTYPKDQYLPAAAQRFVEWAATSPADHWQWESNGLLVAWAECRGVRLLVRLGVDGKLIEVNVIEYRESGG